jgi:hypothetical protein
VGNVKNKSYREMRANGLKLVQLWLDEDKWEQIKKAAESVQEPMTTWIRRSVYTSLRKWVIPESVKLYDPCSICGSRHNRNEHFEETK